MKIYTKKGDEGKTSLIGGTRVKKSHIRIESYGTVDELNSFIGVIRDSAKDKFKDAELQHIQDHLFTLGADLATDKSKSKMKNPILEEKDVEHLENSMDEMGKELPDLMNFIIPGGDLTSSYCHVARCVCRRAERIAIELGEEEEVDPLIIKYLNRLSDYLFTLARLYTVKQAGVETLWKTRN
jgi:cob(I)alamin adenosyltransferase